MKFTGPGTKGVPIWLAVTYLSSNVVLNSLNFYWFGKMIETVRKRFEKKPTKAEENEGGGAGKDEKGVQRNSVRRRRSSIVLEVADGLERDERLRIMMDGAAEGGGPTREEVEGMTDAEQRRDPEDKWEDMAKSSALDDNNQNTNTAAASTRDDGARRR